MARFDAVLFDLDGTLIYTLPDIHAAINRAVTDCGYAPHDLDATRRFVGNGSRALVARSLPAGTPDEEIDRVLSTYRAVYKEALIVESVPYPGIPELLHELRARGIKLGVVTNKPHENANVMMAHFFPGVFDIVEGSGHGHPLKPAPDAALSCAKILGTSPERTLFAGDSEVDADTAKNAGMACVLTAWGYRERALLETKAALAVIDGSAEFMLYI